MGFPLLLGRRGLALIMMEHLLLGGKLQVEGSWLDLEQDCFDNDFSATA